MLRAFIHIVIFLNAPSGTLQLPHLRGSYSQQELTKHTSSLLVKDVQERADDIASFNFHQTDAHIKRPGKSHMSFNKSEAANADTDTCDASCALAALARPTSASHNDVSIGVATGGVVHHERIQHALAAEINNSLADKGLGFEESRTEQLEREMSGLFASLPKNSQGGLEHAATNYAVHQWFVRKYQWYIRNDETHDYLSPGEARRAKVTQELQHLMEKRRGDLGIGLRELASLVATIERVIDGDLIERLKAHYEANKLPLDVSASRQDEVIEAILAMAAGVISLTDRSGFGLHGDVARRDRLMIEKHYPGWQLLRSRVDFLVKQISAHSDNLMFDEVADVARKVTLVFGEVLQGTCADTKRGFAAMPNGSTGIVALADMHAEVLHGKFQYGESAQYLRDHDMTDSGADGKLHVFVPNVLYGPSNCLGGTSFYEVCCPNACESLFEHIENGIRDPAGAPAALVKLVNSHNLSSNLAGGTISPALLDNLNLFAEKHGGKIPIHGYDFADWLNRALPLDCPAPHGADFKSESSDVSEIQSTERDFGSTRKKSMRASMQELMEDTKDALTSQGLQTMSSPVQIAK